MAGATQVRRRNGRVEVTRRIDADPDDAWRLLTDTDRWPEWGPSVRAVEADRRVIETGTTGRIRTPIGVWVPFEVTECDPGGRRWTWRVARLPATGHRVEALDGRCLVTFEVPTLAAAYVPVCRRALDRIEARLTAHSGAASEPTRS